MTVEPYHIAICSRKRPRNMAKMLGFFPDAHIYVDKIEEADYAPVVPAGQLHFHDSLPEQEHIWKWLLEEVCPDKVLVLCDDDLVSIRSQVQQVPFRRQITDPRDIRRIIENAVNLLCDLDLSLYLFNRSGHPASFNPIRPISLTGIGTGIMIVRGRKIVIDLGVKTNFDMDMIMQTLLLDRVLIKDTRFWFEVGNMAGSDQGGNSGKTDMDLLKESRAALHKKWGKWIAIANLPITSRCLEKKEGSGTVENLGHCVNRTSRALGGK